MAKRMRLRSCSKLSASRNRSSGEGSGPGWGLLMEVGSQASGPYLRLSPGPCPAGSIAGITCLTSGSRSSRRTTWLRCWTGSIRKPRGRIRPGATSVPGKNKMVFAFLFSGCITRPLPFLMWGSPSQSFLSL